MKELIKQILKEELSLRVRRLINFNNIKDIVDRNKLVSFQKNKPIKTSVLSTINSVSHKLIEKNLDDLTDDEYNKEHKELTKFLNDMLGKELTEYFEKRKRNVDEDKNPLGIKYIFVKHDKPYYISGWRGFAEGFNSFDDMITRYGNYFDVDWDNIKKKLDDIKDFPESTFTGRHHSRPLRIKSIGDEGNSWGYNFSVIKSIPSENLDRVKEIKEDVQTESELTERCWKGYTQKGMKTMFGKRYPNCVKIKK